MLMVQIIFVMKMSWGCRDSVGGGGGGGVESAARDDDSGSNVDSAEKVVIIIVALMMVIKAIHWLLMAIKCMCVLWCTGQLFAGAGWPRGGCELHLSLPQHGDIRWQRRCSHCVGTRGGQGPRTVPLVREEATV